MGNKTFIRADEKFAVLETPALPVPPVWGYMDFLLAVQPRGVVLRQLHRLQELSPHLSESDVMEAPVDLYTGTRKFIYDALNQLDSVSPSLLYKAFPMLDHTRQGLAYIGWQTEPAIKALLALNGEPQDWEGPAVVVPYWISPQRPAAVQLIGRGGTKYISIFPHTTALAGWVGRPAAGAAYVYGDLQTCMTRKRQGGTTLHTVIHNSDGIGGEQDATCFSKVIFDARSVSIPDMLGSVSLGHAQEVGYTENEVSRDPFWTYIWKVLTQAWPAHARSPEKPYILERLLGDRKVRKWVAFNFTRLGESKRWQAWNAQFPYRKLWAAGGKQILETESGYTLQKQGKRLPENLTNFTVQLTSAVSYEGENLSYEGFIHTQGLQLPFSANHDQLSSAKKFELFLNTVSLQLNTHSLSLYQSRHYPLLRSIIQQQLSSTPTRAGTCRLGWAAGKFHTVFGSYRTNKSRVLFDPGISDGGIFMWNRAFCGKDEQGEDLPVVLRKRVLDVVGLFVAAYLRISVQPVAWSFQKNSRMVAIKLFRELGQRVPATKVDKKFLNHFGDYPLLVEPLDGMSVMPDYMVLLCQTHDPMDNITLAPEFLTGIEHTIGTVVDTVLRNLPSNPDLSDPPLTDIPWLLGRWALQKLGYTWAGAGVYEAALHKLFDQWGPQEACAICKLEFATQLVHLPVSEKQLKDEVVALLEKEGATYQLAADILKVHVNHFQQAASTFYQQELTLSAVAQEVSAQQG